MAADWIQHIGCMHDTSSLNCFWCLRTIRNPLLIFLEPSLLFALYMEVHTLLFVKYMLQLVCSFVLVWKSITFWHCFLQNLTHDYWDCLQEEFSTRLRGGNSCNLRSSWLRCSTRPNEWGTQWDLNSLV